MLCAWCGEPLITVPVLVVGETRYHEICWQRRAATVNDPDAPTPRRDWGIEIPQNEAAQGFIVAPAPTRREPPAK